MPTSHSEEKSSTKSDVKPETKAEAKAEAKADSKAETGAGEEASFDQVLDRLRLVVQRLEQGSLPLDQALKAFEEGVRLSRRGSSILDAAEQRVELLLREDDGTETRKPLNPAGNAELRSAESRPASS